LVVVENTHNRAGGRVFSAADVEGIVAVARREGLKLHLDGARVWNAAVALGRPAAELCAGFDTVSACFSKGLGAPVGSALVGAVATIAAALRFRKMLGGGMRQAGILAAGALHALEHHRERLAEDHQNARRLAAALGELDGIEVGTVETNIVNVDLPCDAERVVAGAARRGVLLSAVGSRRLRLVTHLDVAGPAFERALGAIVEAHREALAARG
jgi:threonine aldolase